MRGCDEARDHAAVLLPVPGVLRAHFENGHLGGVRCDAVHTEVMDEPQPRPASDGRVDVHHRPSQGIVEKHGDPRSTSRGPLRRPPLRPRQVEPLPEASTPLRPGLLSCGRDLRGSARRLIGASEHEWAAGGVCLSGHSLLVPDCLRNGALHRSGDPPGRLGTAISRCLEADKTSIRSADESSSTRRNSPPTVSRLSYLDMPALVYPTAEFGFVPTFHS